MPLSRRGMSPLIATVLLMAFAVALGGMIMNLSIDLGASEACEGITVQFPEFCARDRQIDLRLYNTPDSAPLQGIRVDVTDGGVESSLNVKSSAVAPGGRLDIGIPYPASPGAAARVIAIVGSPSAPYACAETPLIIADPLPPC